MGEERVYSSSPWGHRHFGWHHGGLHHVETVLNSAGSTGSSFPHYGPQNSLPHSIPQEVCAQAPPLSRQQAQEGKAGSYGPEHVLTSPTICSFFDYSLTYQHNNDKEVLKKDKIIYQLLFSCVSRVLFITNANIYIHFRNLHCYLQKFHKWI